MSRNNLAHIDEDEISLSVVSFNEHKRKQLLQLQSKLRRLREEITEVMPQIKQCRNSFEDANKMAGELHDTLKTRS